MKTCMRTVYCANPRISDIGQSISVCGWVQRRRDLGGLIFIDLRDRSGILQLAFDENTKESVFADAASCRSEFVLRASGIIRERSSKNPELATGDIELGVTELSILAASETPPFEIAAGKEVNDALRLKYRYLDLRRPEMQENLRLRHRVAKIARDYFDERGFLEIETPMLTKSTPEGARDYLVPSRIHPGKFYALPQSPQQYKQLLMLAGFDRYMQITRCFRDEDLRADRQPDFTQLDLEMSFVDEEDIYEVLEGFIGRLFWETLGIRVELPLPRMSYAEAMSRFGSDKPDTRFGNEICDISDIAAACGFKVFRQPAENGGSVRLINVKNGASAFPRKKIDALGEFVKGYGAKGLAWARFSGGECSSSFSKFLAEEEFDAIKARAEVTDGDLLLAVADTDTTAVFSALGALRLECARIMGIIPKDRFNFLWVTQFPMFEYSEEEGRFVAMHHPFTSIVEEDITALKSDKAKCRARAYDMVLNGTELGSGSIRISTPEAQSLVFGELGLDAKEAEERFGHLLTAFKYGAPPHGGFAFGLDRLVMLMSGADTIKDVIAFPKAQNASELMTGAPSEAYGKQLEELSLRIDTDKK